MIYDGPDSVTLASSHGTTHRIPIDAPIAVAGFASELWIVHGNEPRLSQYALDGRLLSSTSLAPVRDGVLLGAPSGRPVAVWVESSATTNRQAIVVFEEDGELNTVATGATTDLALPVIGTNFLWASGSSLIGSAGLSCDLGMTTQIVGGSVILEGCAAALIVERPQGHELVVVNLINGQVRLRHPIPTCELRVATRRGLMAMRTEAEHIVVVDLRTGRVACDLPCAPDIVDFTIAPGGRRIALRRIDHEVELVTVSETSPPPPRPIVGQGEPSWLRCSNAEAHKREE